MISPYFHNFSPKQCPAHHLPGIAFAYREEIKPSAHRQQYLLFITYYLLLVKRQAAGQKHRQNVSFFILHYLVVSVFSFSYQAQLTFVSQISEQTICLGFAEIQQLSSFLPADPPVAACGVFQDMLRGSYGSFACLMHISLDVLWSLVYIGIKGIVPVPSAAGCFNKTGFHKPS
jgi:hypothetical protein